jgi:hypothetical protein
VTTTPNGKKIDLTFVLAEVDWVVTTLCPTESVAPVKEANESDADWQKRERGTMLPNRWRMICKSKSGSMPIKKCVAVIKNTIEPTIMG